MVGWLSGHLHATRCRSLRLPTSLSHPAPQGLCQPTRHNCRSCWEEPHTVDHWFRQCHNPVVLRQQLFSETSPLFLVLTTDPDSALALSTQTLTNCKRNSLHRHLTKCRSYRFANLWMQVSLSRRCPDTFVFFGRFLYINTQCFYFIPTNIRISNFRSQNRNVPSIYLV